MIDPVGRAGPLDDHLHLIGILRVRRQERLVIQGIRTRLLLPKVRQTVFVRIIPGNCGMLCTAEMALLPCIKEPVSIYIPGREQHPAGMQGHKEPPKLMIGIFISGVLAVIRAFQLRPAPGWGWFLFSGIIRIILGIIIWSEWPSNPEWLIGKVFGLFFLVSGLSLIILGVTIRLRAR